MFDFLNRRLGWNKSKSEESDFEYLNKRWGDRHERLRGDFQKKHGTALEWLKRNVSGGQLALGSLGGLMLLTIPGVGNFLPSPSSGNTGLVTNKLSRKTVFLGTVIEGLPKDPRPLLPDEEKAVTEILSAAYGFEVTAELDLKRINTNYGLMGAEQNLYRFPGDTLEKHFVTEQERQLYEQFGIAPGLGAWGYFAPSEAALTEQAKAREKYYVVVQTFLSPGFSSNVRAYGDFFKYRKVLVVNPQNGLAIVGDIGDSGPAPWTGKQFGGSPAVMHSLGLDGGPRKGAVLIFFIDDKEDKIPLGPVEMS